MIFIEILAVIALVVIVLGFFSEITDKQKAKISREVSRSGGEVISISLSSFGKNQHYRYRVLFSDPFGNKHHSSCSVTGINGKIFWSKSPREIILESQVSQDNSQPTGQLYVEPSILSSKEQIIEDLHAENMRLQEEVARLREDKE